MKQVKEMIAECRARSKSLSKGEAPSTRREIPLEVESGEIVTKIIESDGRTKISFKSQADYFHPEIDPSSVELIDNTLDEVKDEEGEIKEYKNRRNKFDVRIKSKLSSKEGVVFADAKHQVRLIPQGRKIKAKKSKEGKITFSKFNKFDDLEYLVHSNGFKEQIIVKEKREGEYEYLFKLNVENLLVELQGKDIIFLDKETKTPLYRMGKLFMFDADDKQSDEIEMELLSEEENFTIRLVADSTWINVSERVFPVTINPQIDLIQTSMISLKSIIDGKITEASKSKYKIGVFDGQTADLVVSIDAKNIIETIKKEKLTAFKTNVTLNLLPGNRPKTSNGFVVYGENQIICEDSFLGDQANIDITSIIRDRLLNPQKSTMLELTIKSKDASLTTVKSMSLEKALYKFGFEVFSLGESEVEDNNFPDADSKNLASERIIKKLISKIKSKNLNTMQMRRATEIDDTDIVDDNKLSLTSSIAKSSRSYESGITSESIITDIANAIKANPNEKTIVTKDMVVINLDAIGSTSLDIQSLKISNPSLNDGIANIAINADNTLMVPDIKIWHYIGDIIDIKNFTFIVRTTSDYNDYTQVVSDDFGIEVEYIQKGLLPDETVKLDYSLGKSGTTTVELFDGEYKHSIPITSLKADTLEVPLALVYSSNLRHEKNGETSKKYMGKGWKTNFHQYLFKSCYDEKTGVRNINYIDGNNNICQFNESWYYEIDNQKHYVERDFVYLDSDGKLKFTDAFNKIHEIKYEVTNNQDLQYISIDAIQNYKKRKKDLSYYIEYKNGVREYLKMENGKLLVPHFYMLVPELVSIETLEFVQSKVYYEFTNIELKDGKYICYGGEVFREYFPLEIRWQNNYAYVRTYCKTVDCSYPDRILGVKKFYNINVFSEEVEKIEDQEKDYLNSEAIESIAVQINQKKDYFGQLSNQANDLVDAMEAIEEEQTKQERIQLINEDIALINKEIRKGEDEIRNNRHTFYNYKTYSAVGGFKLLDALISPKDSKDLGLTLTSPENESQVMAYAIQPSSVNIDKAAYYLNVFDYYAKKRMAELDYEHRNIIIRSRDLEEYYRKFTNETDKNVLLRQFNIYVKKLETTMKKIKDCSIDINDLEKNKQDLIAEQKRKVHYIITDGESNTFGFDYYGKLVMVMDKNENQVDIVYDDANKLIQLNSKTQIMKFYYASDLLDYILDSRGRKIKVEHNEQGNLSVIRFPSPSDIVSFDYTEDGDLSAIIDRTGLIQKISYSINYGVSEISKVAYDELILSKYFERKSYNNYKVKDLLTNFEENYYFDEKGKPVSFVKKENKFINVELNHYLNDKLRFNVSGRILKKFFKYNITSPTTLYKKKISLCGNKLPASNMLLLLCKIGEVSENASFILKAIVKNRQGIIIGDFKENISVLSDSYIGLPIIVNRSLDINKVVVEIQGENQFSSFNNIEVSLISAEGIYYCFDGDKLIKVETGNYKMEYCDFDGNNPRLIRKSDRFGNTKETRYSYDYEGKITFEENYLGNCKEIFYNEKSQIIEIREYNKKSPTEAKISKIKYDDKGNAISNDCPLLLDTLDFKESVVYLPGTSLVEKTKNASGNITSYGYNYDSDSLTEMSTIIDDIKTSNQYGYKFGLISTLSHNGFDIDYNYDIQGRKKAIDIAKRRLVDFEYENIKQDDFVVANKASAKFNNDLKIETITGTRGLIEQINTIDPLTGTTEVKNSYDGYDRLLSKVSWKDETKVEEENFEYDMDYLSKRTICKEGREEIIQVQNFTPENLLDEITTKLKPESLEEKDIKISKKLIYDKEFDNRLSGIILNEVEVNDDNEECLHKCYVDYKYDANSRIISQNFLKDDSETGEYKELISDSFDYLTKENNRTELVKTHTIKVNQIYLDEAIYDYDSCGNIILIKTNDNEIRYRYDSLNRLIREDNFKFNGDGRTFTYRYDKGGNIVMKKESPYTLEEFQSNSAKHLYTYKTNGWNDQLISFDDKEIKDYDNLGRPEVYMGNELKWSSKGELLKFNNTHFTYNNDGIRISKNIDGQETKFTVLDGKILRSKSKDADLIFHHSFDKVIGFNYNGIAYHYLRNIQGDITHILNSDGKIVAKYIYDAWGNYQIYNGEGNLIKEGENEELTIGEINPFRYRGSYVDQETGLIYLNSRYYDPQVGRFISPDSLEYLDLKRINGLNLYSYCGNNPIMNCDPNGTFFGTILGGIIGGLWGGVTALINHQNVWKGIVHGAAVGALTGAIVDFAIATGGLGGLAIAGLGGFVVGFAGDIAGQMWLDGKSWGEVNLTQAAISGLINGGLSVVSFGVGSAINGAVISKTFTVASANLANAIFGFAMGLGAVTYSIIAGQAGSGVSYTVNDFSNYLYNKFVIPIERGFENFLKQLINEALRKQY